MLYFFVHKYSKSYNIEEFYMHPRNKMRLMAGLTIDHSLEKTVTEAREVPNRNSVATANEKNLDKKENNILKAEAHMRNAVKALETAPATDMNATIPQIIKEIESLCNDLISHAKKVSKVKPVKEAVTYDSEKEEGKPYSPPVTYQEGDKVFYDNGVWLVHVADGEEVELDKNVKYNENGENIAVPNIFIIPPSLKDASDDEKAKAGQSVAVDKCRKPSPEEVDEVDGADNILGTDDDENSAEDYDPAMGGDEMAPTDMRMEAVEKCTECGCTVGSPKKGCDCKHHNKVDESTGNFTPSNVQSWEDNDTDPVNVVGHGKENWANSLDPKHVKNEYPNQMDQRGDQSMDDYVNKVTVPSTIKTSLKGAIAEISKELDSQGNGHTANENKVFYTECGEAFTKLQTHLNGGTIQDIKLAQIFASSLMGPILHKLPKDVWDFIANGGKKRSLKDYMNKVGK